MNKPNNVFEQSAQAARAKYPEVESMTKDALIDMISAHWEVYEDDDIEELKNIAAELLRSLNSDRQHEEDMKEWCS